MDRIAKKIKSKITWRIYLLCFLMLNTIVMAQDDKEKEKIEKETSNLLRSASSELESDDFIDAEVDLRKAISLSPTNETGKYNLGNAYYEKELNDEAMRRYVQAAEVALTKTEKHKAFHNLGNTFMNAKKYQEAVEAYKNALRNNPGDDETRYNLALAKEMLEKNPPQGGDDDKDEENKDDENKDQEENKDDQGKDQEGDEGDEKEDKDKGDEKDENKEGDNKDDKGNPKDPNEQKDGEGEQPQQQKPVPGQLSPQQIKNLLEAMNNEEKKVQDKINARKQKGAKVKSDKDW
jgi:tetratricopeptide (TPR) repeat protein